MSSIASDIASSASSASSSVLSMESFSAATRNRFANASMAPSFLRGWHFLSFSPAVSNDAIAIRAVAAEQGPTISFNPAFVDAEHLEDPASAMLWLPIALNHLCIDLLLETDDNGLLANENWQDFRLMVCDQMTMDWEDILEATERLGTAYMAETLASAMFVETGLMDILMERRAAKTGMLKSA